MLRSHSGRIDATANGQRTLPRPCRPLPRRPRRSHRLPFGTAVEIEGTDLNGTGAVLRKARVTTQERPDRLLAPPSDGFGAWIGFHRPGAPALWNV